MGIVLAFIIFSVLVLFHEFGHFLLAKKNGIGVTEFSLGMGPRIASFVKGETRYSWKAIPFGGSCMMVGEDEDNTAENAFNNKSVWARISVIAAGPIFNFILAFVFAIVFIGMQGYDKATVNYVSENYAASEAGLQEGDVITEFDGEKVVIYRDLWLYQYVNPLTEEDVHVKYVRDGKTYETTLTPSKAYSLGITYVPNEDEAKITVTEGTPIAEAGAKTDDIIVAVGTDEIASGEELGKYFSNHPLTGKEIDVTVQRGEEKLTLKVTPKFSGYTLGLSVGEYVKASPMEVIRYSFTELRYDMKATLEGVKQIFTGKANRDSVSGPVGIVKVVGDSYNETKDYGVKMVFLQMVYLLIILSVNLGVVNLFPFPALDGGRLVFLFIEAVRGKPVPREKEAIVHFAGIIILLILMVVIMFNDITKFFR